MVIMQEIRGYPDAKEYSYVPAIEGGLTVGDISEKVEIFELDFLYSGLIPSTLGYPVFLTPEDLEKIAPTFIKKPVFIDHNKINANNFEREVVGWVVSVNTRYNEDTGKSVWYARILIEKNKKRGEEAIKLLKNGWKASCEYWTIKKTLAFKFGKECYIDIEAQGQGIAIVEKPNYAEVEVCKVINSQVNMNESVAHNITEDVVKKSVFEGIKAFFSSNQAKNAEHTDEDQDKKLIKKMLDSDEVKNAVKNACNEAIDEYEKKKEAQNKAKNEEAEAKKKEIDEAVNKAKNEADEEAKKKEEAKNSVKNSLQFNIDQQFLAAQNAVKNSAIDESEEAF